MLEKNPEERISISEIKDHPWYKEETIGQNLEREYLMKLNGINPEDVKDNLSTDRLNETDAEPKKRNSVKIVEDKKMTDKKRVSRSPGGRYDRGYTYNDRNGSKGRSSKFVAKGNVNSKFQRDKSPEVKNQSSKAYNIKTTKTLEPTNAKKPVNKK